MKSKTFDISGKFRLTLIAAALSVVLSFAFYGNSLHYDFNLDDNYILDGVPEETGSFANIFQVFRTPYDQVDYRPVPMLTFALQQYIYGSITAYHGHLYNVLLFAISAITLYWLISALLHRIPDLNGKRYTALIPIIAMVLFISLPVHSNVVCSIKNRDIIISFIFSSLALIFFIQVFRSGNRWLLIPAFASLLLALYSKLDAYWVIFTVPVYYILFENRLRPISVLKGIGLLAVLFFIALIIRFRLPSLFVDFGEVENAILFTENPMIIEDFFGKVYYVVITFFYYVKFMVVPTGYYFYFGYQTTPAVNFTHPVFLSGILLILGIVASMIRAYLKKDYLLLSAIILFPVALVYCLNIITPIAGIFAPRLAFPASFGFAFVLAIILERTGRLLDSRIPISWALPVRFKSAYILTIAFVLLYLPFNLHRNMAWKDFESLMDTDIPHLHQSFQANRIATSVYLRAAGKMISGQSGYDEKRVHELATKGLYCAQRAARLNPESAYAHEGIGIAYRLLGQNEAALNQLAITVNRFGDSEAAWDIMGDILVEAGEFYQAGLCYEKTITISPDYQRVYEKYSEAMVRAGRIDDAIEFLQQQVSEQGMTYPLQFHITYLNGLK